MDEAVSLVAPYKDSPYRIGYFSDNEVGWWNGALFVFYSQKPADNFTKQRWLAYVKERYGGDWDKFTADFVPPQGVSNWGRALWPRPRPPSSRPGSHEVSRRCAAGPAHRVCPSATTP